MRILLLNVVHWKKVKEVKEATDIGITSQANFLLIQYYSNQQIVEIG